MRTLAPLFALALLAAASAASAGCAPPRAVPASHLDDALESLVVLTPGHADPVRGVSFGSHVSRGMARAMAGLPTDADAPITYRDLIASLKGARVDVRTRSGGVVGRLIDVDEADAQADPAKKDDAKPTARLVLLTDGAELVRVAAPDVVSVRPTDAAYAARLEAALDALSSRATQGRKMLDLLGAVRGPVTLAYVAETPVWRTTYRFVMDERGAGTLQGWALVHNDTDEDWNGVRVELVNGRPDSFLFPLAAPRYARRSLVHPDDELSTVPQLLGTTADAIWGDQGDDSYRIGGVSLAGTGEGGGGAGSGVGLGSVATLRRGISVRSSPVIAVGDLAAIGKAETTEAGALFVYSLPDRLALRAHASSLVPFLQGPVDAEAIAWVDRGQPHARSGVRFVNSTRQTLPGGTLAVFAAGGFAGESALDRLKPGERRFVRFGADLDVDVRVERSRVDEAPERLTFEQGGLIEHFVRTTTATYSLENRSGRPRAIYVTMPIDKNAKITGADTVDYDTASSTPLAVFRAGAGVRAERDVVSVEGLSRRLELNVLQADRLAEIAGSPRLAAADKAIALDGLKRLRELEETHQAKDDATASLEAIEKELERLREDAKAVGGERGGAPAAELVKRLLAAEDRHAAIRKRLDALDIEEKGRTATLTAALARLGAS
jgi:hypothetical protein